jgi:mannosyl-glycoprotein endo-beta-N-acetylglucosaminidase
VNCYLQINIENVIDEVQIPNLMVFVSHLTKVMHSSVPGGLVIWYDSVTIDGHLAWQDQLTENNKPFFDICDGIFMNYTWKVWPFTSINHFIFIHLICFDCDMSTE